MPPLPLTYIEYSSYPIYFCQQMVKAGVPSRMISLMRHMAEEGKGQIIPLSLLQLLQKTWKKMLKNILINSLDNMVSIKMFSDAFLSLLVKMNKKLLEPEKVMCLYQSEVQNIQIISQFLGDYRINQGEFLAQYQHFIIDILHGYLTEGPFDKIF